MKEEPPIKGNSNVCVWRRHIEKTESARKQENSDRKAACSRHYLRKILWNCYEIVIFLLGVLILILSARISQTSCS